MWTLPFIIYATYGVACFLLLALDSSALARRLIYIDPRPHPLQLDNALKTTNWMIDPAGDKSSIFRLNGEQFYVRCNKATKANQKDYTNYKLVHAEIVYKRLSKLDENRLFPQSISEFSTKAHGSCTLYSLRSTITQSLKTAIPLIVKDNDKRWLSKVIHEVVKGIDALHSINYMHSAIISSNILVSEYVPGQEPTVAIVGLEQAIPLDSAKVQVKKTFYNAMPPEILTRSKVNGRSYDAWMLGALIYECFSGLPPYDPSLSVYQVGFADAHYYAKETLKQTITAGLNFCPPVVNLIKTLSNDEASLLGLMDGLLRPGARYRTSLHKAAKTPISDWARFRQALAYERMPI
ncbi:hypothetical protein BDF19DRAFT_423454 [Syncephalis fuscata]|nr:hypothetical protein BDF19DRAFT_423454 [Syncephalis fuscata]